MGKHPRKRQKTSKDEVQPLGSAKIDILLDEASKDDEERRLENMLFGTKFIPRGDKGKGGDGLITVDFDDENVDEEAGPEMQHLLDTDLFFVDDSAPGVQDKPFDLDPGFTASLDEGEADSEEDSENDLNFNSSKISTGFEESDRDDESSENEKEEPAPSNSLQPRTSKGPAWTDPSDIAPTATVSLLSGPSRLRKLRDAPAEDTITSREYETRLRRQFERVNPEPTWAKNARKVRAGMKVGSAGEDESGEDEDEDVQDLISSTAGILAKKTHTKARVLPAGALAIERLRDANQAAQGSGSGEVRVVTFHPSDRVPVLCVATADRRIRLFNVDGHTSPLLTTLHIPSLPLTSPTSVSFHPLGSSLLVTGPRPFFYTHDLQTGATVHHARGLWGTTFSAANDAAGGRKRARAQSNGKDAGGGGEGMSLTAFSPHTGDMLAVAGRGGYVHLVDWKSGAGQVFGSLKCGGGGGGVQGMWWVPRSDGQSVLGGGQNSAGGVGAAGAHLAVMSGDAEVYLWDVGQRRCVKRWKDEGGFRGAGKVMAGTSAGPNGGWLAVGSNTGLVNVYDSDSFSLSATSETFSSSEKPPKPVKTIANLTTSISALRFNHDAQIMAVASKEKKDAMRLIHLPSLTAFANWPTSGTPLGHVTAVDFSARSDYVAVGNTRGRVLLYHLRDYGAGNGTY